MTEPRNREDDRRASDEVEPLDPWELKPVIRDPRVMARARAMSDLFELAVKIQRQNLRRCHPDASDEEVSRRLREWLHHRPGAEHGDASGPDFVVSKRFAHLLGRGGDKPNR